MLLAARTSAVHVSVTPPTLLPTLSTLPLPPLQAMHGGHRFAVSCLVASGQYLFSADFGGTIKVLQGTVLCYAALRCAAHSPPLPCVTACLGA